MSRKKHHKVKVRGKEAHKASEMSPLAKFVHSVALFRQKCEVMGRSSVLVGWVDGKKETERTQPKEQALSKNKLRKARKLKGKGELVSNFDANFVGPGGEAASLATIARVMRYGRAGGINKKTGASYGAIPARDFVKVMHEKFTEPILHLMRDETNLSFVKNAPPPLAVTTLNRLGDVCKGQLQRAMMASNEYKANAPITVKGGWMANPKNGKPFHIEGKKSSRPLWNTGTLINSMSYEVKQKV